MTTPAPGTFAALNRCLTNLADGGDNLAEIAANLLLLAFRDIRKEIECTGGLIIPQSGIRAGKEIDFLAYSTKAEPKVSPNFLAYLQSFWTSEKQSEIARTHYDVSGITHTLTVASISFGFDPPIGYLYAETTGRRIIDIEQRLLYVAKHFSLCVQSVKGRHAIRHLGRVNSPKKLNQESGVEELIRTTANNTALACLQALSCTAVIVWLKKENDRLVTIATTGVAAGKEFDMRVGQGASGKCAEKGIELRIDDLLDEETNKRLHNISKLHHATFVTQKRIRSALIIPIKNGDETIGVLSAYAVRVRGFSTIDVELARAFTQGLSAGIAQYQKLQELEEFRSRLDKDAETIEAGMGAIEHIHDIINELTIAQNHLFVAVQTLPEQVLQSSVSIRSLAGALSEKEFPTVEDALEKVQGNVSHSLETVIEMGKPARFRVLRPKRVELLPLVENVISRIETKLGSERIEVELQIDPGIRLSIDEHKMERVFANLIGNSAEFLSRDTKGRQRKIGIKAKESDSDFSIIFFDNGVGIAPHDLKKVFDYFFTSRSNRGMGFGLAIARRNVELHGGTITVESKWGYWTKFLITLPKKYENEK